VDPSQIKRIDFEADPERCQGVNAQGQCRNKAVSGGTHCLVHGGNKQLQSQKTKALNNYRLDRWKARVSRLAHSPDVKNLRDEVGILRMVLEEVVNQCHSSNDLILRSQQINQLVLNIDKVVTSCHKLEGSMGQLLDKSAVLQLAGKALDLISRYVSDPDEQAKLAEELLNVVDLDDTTS
jgi:hypothetical protein